MNAFIGEYIHDVIAQELPDYSKSLHALCEISLALYIETNHIQVSSFSALAYEDSLIVLFVFYFKRAFLHNYSNYSCLYLDVESFFNVSIFCFS